VCTEQGHDNLSPQQAQQAYGNDHACQQNRTASPL
jgi:hypothetical protein